MNHVILLGRLTKDVEIKNTNSDKAYCRFTLAVPRNFKDANGNIQSDFISCIAWGKTAGLVSKFFKKGSRMMITGTITTSTYKGSDGVTKYSTDVTVLSVEFIDSKNSNPSTTTADTSARPETKGKPVAPSFEADDDFGFDAPWG